VKKLFDKAKLVNEKQTSTVRRLRLVAWMLCLGLLLAWTSAVHADWIPGYPAEPGLSGESPTNLDITTWFLEVSYDGAGHFSAVSQYPGVAVMNNFSDPIYDIGPNAALSLSVTLTPSGQPTSGSITITGDATSYYVASSSGTLLTGTIAKFGFADPTEAATDSGSENFQLIFSTTGGDLASLFPAIAVNLELVDVNFDGTFGATAFDDASGNAQADSFSATLSPVPEPSTLGLLCFGALTLMTGLVILRGTRKLRGSPMG
jgi:hypothetical protein